MKPSARIQKIINLLELKEEINIPLDKMLADYMRNNRYIGSKDRAYISENIYNIIRAQAKISWWLEQAKSENSPRNTAICYLVKIKEREEKEIKKLFDASKYSPDELTDKEKELIKLLVKTDDKKMPVSVKCECPKKYEEILKKIWGEKFEQELLAMLEPATLDLRVNTAIINRENAKASLEKDEVRTTKTPYSPWGLRTENKIYLSKTKAFKKGFVDIQDEGSQLISFLCDAKPSMQVLDYCAGGGGKTLSLAASMQKKGRIVAMDIDARRLEKSKSRFRRAKVSDIIEPRPLTEERNRKWLRRQKGTFDITLIDVPCSGTGTWRRNPDMRWNNYGPSLEELIKTQSEILDKVAHTVKNGGKLVYATCSLLPEENEKQIESFLKRNKEFKLLPLIESWPEGYNPPCEGDYMRLTPYQHNTDGFFAAVMIRNIS